MQHIFTCSNLSLVVRADYTCTSLHLPPSLCLEVHKMTKIRKHCNLFTVNVIDLMIDLI